MNAKSVEIREMMQGTTLLVPGVKFVKTKGAARKELLALAARKELLAISAQTDPPPTT